MQSPEQILKQYWGFDNFRPLQRDIIESILQKKDTLAILPTGGGKSICFQVPALMLDGICLVVSPLIALIKDQVSNLEVKGIAALSIHSGMTFHEVKQTLQKAAFGEYKFLYVSPERLQSDLFREYLPAIKPTLVAIDESHCISQWGYDFRPAYLKIAEIRKELPGVPVIALTASATPEVQEDICDKLNFSSKDSVFRQSFSRANLSYSVFDPVSKQSKMLEVLEKVPGTALVYCKSRRQTQQLSELLVMQKISAAYYHAGLSSADRNDIQQRWINNQIRVIVSTNAFGMGIDKPDVRAVIHFEPPDCLENYYQEAGRAGRDGKKAYAVLLSTTSDANEIINQVDLRFPDLESLRSGYISLMNYLQVPAGIGEWQTFDFDIADFSSKFRLNILQATYVIQALAKEGLLSYNDTFFKPSTIRINSDRATLDELQKTHPELSEIVKGVLRSYEGVMDNTVNIHETSIARLLNISVDELKQKLPELHRRGIAEYQQQKETPQIFLYQNRMYSDDFKFDMTAHLQRKNAYEKRAIAMQNYLTNEVNCRSKLISTYFGEPSAVDCNVCDNCLKRKNGQLGKKEFDEIAAYLLQLISVNEISISEIEKRFNGTRKDSLWRVLDFLAAEDKIDVGKTGMVRLKPVL